MSLSLCSHCGGHIQLGPDASNVCEVCGKHVMSGPEQPKHIPLSQDEKAVEAGGKSYYESLGGVGCWEVTDDKFKAQCRTDAKRILEAAERARGEM